ncbi:MAG: hypothetical protein K8R10_10960 [Rhodocyclales bacterium]|nr:hypothetical protein [Rhodocyclales bacterium]
MNLSTMLDPNTLALLDQLGISAATVESALASLAIFTILTLVTAIPTVILAKRKGRSVAGWLLLALSLPVLPLLLVWLLPTLPNNSGE